MTLTFDLSTWFLHATYRLSMMIISAKLFSNSMIPDGYELDTILEHTYTHVDR